MEKTKKPVIRFNGFTEDWEKRKLSDIAKRVTRKNTDLQSTLPLTISSQYGLVDQITYFNNRIASQNISGYYLIKNGEFAYNKSSSDGFPFGTVKRLDRYDMGVLSTLYIIFALKDDSVSSQFLVSYYDTDYWHKQVSERAAEGARNHGLLNISADDFLDTELLVPSEVEEQDAIASYMKNLDNLIANAQQKYDKLQTFKKSMLEKMLPQNGEKEPEVRFAGFDGEWNEYRFGDVVDRYSDPVATPTNGYTRLGIRSHGKGTFHNEVLPGMELETAQMHRVAANNFIVNITFGWEHAVAITEEADAGKLVSHRFPQYSFHDGMIPKFFKYLILDEKFRQHLELASPGGAGRNRVLKLDDMLEYKFMVPSAPEQETIANYLIKVDELIKLKQLELEKLKNIKSALLEKMFV